VDSKRDAVARGEAIAGAAFCVNAGSNAGQEHLPPEVAQTTKLALTPKIFAGCGLRRSCFLCWAVALFLLGLHAVPDAPHALWPVVRA
jgi:hypothetical protein